MKYQEEDFLQLSGLQHFKFCRRQWALIHVEKQWAENYRTTDGAIMHENAHDGSFTESRGDLVITRDMRVFSRTLGVSGACDVLEFRHGETGIPLKGREGLWQPYPVEYKRGKPKEGTEDTLQLCGQAMCLEEMLCCEIPRGALYYGEPRRRTEVDFTPELRQEVRALLEEMHALYARGNTPKVKPTKGCNACSLKGLCLPKLMRSKSVSAYLRRRFFGGRPLIAHTDAMMIRELRRIGGLLKHNFETLRQSGAGVDMLERQERALELLVSAIEHLGVPGHDSEESQTGNRR